MHALLRAGHGRPPAQSLLADARRGSGPSVARHVEDVYTCQHAAQAADTPRDARRKAAKRATRARRERARGAARSGAPEQWRPDPCTTRRASASVAGATTTDRWHRSNTLPPARAAQLHREAHRKLSEQTPGFERDERVEGKRTAASRVREEVCRHVDLPSPSVVILLATAAPRCGCGASIMVGT